MKGPCAKWGLGSGNDLDQFPFVGEKNASHGETHFWDDVCYGAVLQ